MAPLTLGTWFLALLLALPLGAGLLQGRVSLAVQALAVCGGFAALIVYLATDEPAGLAWTAAALGAIGVWALTVGSVGLVRDERPVYSDGAQRASEHEATMAGVELPLLIVASVLAVLTALGVGS